jgi:hypothetical protein
MEHNQPDSSDVQKLRRLTPGEGYSSLDDMACTVIFETVKRRRLQRSLTGADRLFDQAACFAPLERNPKFIRNRGSADDTAFTDLRG